MITDLHLPWLELAIFSPLVVAAICIFLGAVHRNRQLAVVTSWLTVAFTVGEWLDFNALGTLTAEDPHSLIRWFLGRDLFVVDELSAPLLPMIAVLFALVILTTMRSKASRFSFGLAMLAESIILATFSCSDPLMLIVLLTGSAFLPWLEIRRRGYNSRCFAIYMSAHVVLLILGTMALHFGNLPLWAKTCAVLALVASSLIRAGIFPAHSWIIDLFEKAPFGTALLFVSPMTGAYVVMRLVFPVVPIWALHGVALLSLVTAVYTAAMAMIQVEARRFFAFLFLSHSALVLAGLEIANPIGMTGALCIWLATGLSLGGVAIALRSVEARIGRISLDQYHGLFEHMPYLGSLFLMTGLASIGFPGGLAFIGMELLIEGTVEVYPIVGTLMVLAAVFNGVAVLRAYFRIFTGTRHVASIFLGARPAERFAVIYLTLLILGSGILPGLAVKSRYHAAETLREARSLLNADKVSVEAVSEEPSALDALLHLEEPEISEHSHSNDK